MVLCFCFLQTLIQEICEKIWLKFLEFLCFLGKCGQTSAVASIEDGGGVMLRISRPSIVEDVLEKF